MLHRRTFLLSGLALSGCASALQPARRSPAADASLRALLNQIAAAPPTERLLELRAFDRDRLTRDGEVLFQSVLKGTEASAAITRDFAFDRGNGPYVVTHRAGAYRRVGAVMTRGETEIASLIADIDADTAHIGEDAAVGVIPPDFILTRTLEALAAARTQASAHADLAAALQRQQAAVQALAPRAEPNPSVARFANGERYYELCLQAALGDSIDPRRAHEKALARVRELQGEADALLRAQGLSQGSVAERLRLLTQDERHLFADTNEGRDAAIAYMNTRLERMRTLLPAAFHNLGETPAQVRRMSPEDEARRAAGRRDGDFYLVDLANIRARPRWTLPSVVYHELIPGHLLQGPLQQAANPPRLQVQSAGGYNEGWAIYAEQLASEIGAYDDDPLGRIGYLQWMLFRIGRVVADIGIHALGWDRARAIHEMREMQGGSIAFVSIEEDVDRFCVSPGFYAAQGLSAMDLAEQRARARRRFGNRFDLAAFHDAALRRGPLTPPGLALAIDRAFAAPR